MLVVFVCLRLFQCQTSLQRGNLSVLGVRLIGDSGTVVGEPGKGVILVKKTRQSNSALNFESIYEYNGSFVHYAPTTTPGYAFMNALLNDQVRETGEFAGFRLVFDGERGTLRYRMRQDTSECPEVDEDPVFLYRTMRGNTTGLSKTVIRSSIDTNITIFEPWPKLCTVNEASLAHSFKMTHGLLFSLNITRGWNEYSFEYRCRFPHWSEFPTNPDRGFVLGPIIAFVENRTVFGNAENMVLPTPDFSMVFNTPILTGLTFAFTLAFVVRMVLQRD